MKRKCYIFGAGEYFSNNISVEDGSLVIAADGGYRYLKKNKIEPDIILGDFDSLEDVPQGENVIKYNREKDETDMFLAVEEGIRRGCEEFHIFGGTGGRLEHTLANIQCIANVSKRGMSATLYGDSSVITAITNSEIKFDEKEEGMISVFAHGDSACGVYEDGLKYSLDNATLTNDNPMGTSNEFCGKESKVKVENGTLIIVMDKNY